MLSCCLYELVVTLVNRSYHDKTNLWGNSKTEMCTNVYIFVTSWCSVGYLPNALSGLRDVVPIYLSLKLQQGQSSTWLGTW